MIYVKDKQNVIKITKIITNNVSQNNERENEKDVIFGRNSVAEAIKSGRPLDSVMVARGDRSGSIPKIVADAKEEAARIIERARVEAELEKQKVADEVKKEMVSIASMMAGKVVAGAVDVKVQDSLVEETLKEIGDSTWLS